MSTEPIVVDGHEDIAWNYYNNGRDFLQSALAARAQERGSDVAHYYGARMTGLPESLLGRVALIVGTIFVAPQASAFLPDEKVLYATTEEATAWGWRQLDYYHQLAERSEKIALVRTQSDLDAVLSTWAAGTTLADHQVGIVVGMEGADPIPTPTHLAEWHARGLRVLGPAWTGTRYSGGTRAPGPLTALGRELLDAMAELGMVLDLAHMAPQAMREALDRYEGPLFASHANPLKFRPEATTRSLSDELIRRIAERDGAVGIVPFNLFLVPDWQLGDGKDAATLQTVVAAIDHVCQVTGSARHVGLGSDFDGGFGAESAPQGLDTVADLLSLGEPLRQRGYSAEDVAAILGGNFLRILRAGLPA